MNLARDILDFHGQLQGDRCNWENLWQRISDKVLPEHDGFSSYEPYKGGQDNRDVYDSTTTSAAIKLASALNDMLTPRNQLWHGLTTSEDEINEDRTFKLWAEETRNILFAKRYSARSNFASQIYESFLGLVVFGTTGMFVDKAERGVLRYRSVHLADLYITENSHGVVDYAHRVLRYTALQMKERFTETLPEKVKQALEKNPLEKFEVVHCIKPNDDYMPGSFDNKRMRFKSVYVCVTSKEVLQEGGYNKFPLPVSRYRTAPRQTYGSSPAIQCFADTQMLNEMEKSILRQGQLAVTPPLASHNDAALNAFHLAPGAMNYGSIDDQGRPLVQPLQLGGNFNLGLELSDRRREIINDSFMVNLFQILLEGPSMTATEVMERAREKGQLLAPAGGRQQSELLGGIIAAEMDRLEEDGVLPPKPPILLEAEEAGIEVSVNYTSPLNKAQRAEEGLSIQRTLESVIPLMQIDPKAGRRFKWDEISAGLAEINGMSENYMYSDEELKTMDIQEAQQQQAAQLLEAAPVLAQSGKNFAEAQAIAQSSSGQQLPNIIPQ